ncbi:uncharacterized protein LOC143468852 isoform X2 [Clavelina lepadiformis]|uniref:uncharacterized protein LOC143468852 isoform X2 n=1 Tax=Clavelina lepadiformis TaxID=159417 RepID=UPI004041B8B3
MSRRKQLVPCKVKDSNSKEAAASSNIGRLHQFTDSLLLEKTKKANSENGSMRDGSLLQNDDSLSIDSLISPSSKHATSSISGIKLPSNVMVKAMDSKQSRFSARIRARSLLGKTTTYISNGDSIQIFRREEAFPNFSLGNDIGKRIRNISTDEELVCPICNKSFMSKYGFLTHSEVHNTHNLKCNLCSLSFPTRSTFVEHQMTMHMKKNSNSLSYLPLNMQSTQKSTNSKVTKTTSGFSDLSFVDFSCKNFSAVAESICAKSAHLVTERDRRHFFMCKECNMLFPTVFSLKFHMSKNHDLFYKTPTAKLTMAGKTYILSNDKSAQSVGEEPFNLRSQNAAESNQAINFMKILALTPSAKSVSAPFEEKGNKLVGYGMDNNKVRTSPMVAYLNVPSWLRKQVGGGITCKLDTDTTERPPLKLKLVRRRSSGHKENDECMGLENESNNNYFVDEQAAFRVTDKRRKALSCETCLEVFTTETALGGHKAASMCGIGVRSSKLGRKMYWCRLCNYASFEKSTILRHQRTHTGIRPYSCKFCRIAFTTKANCERHIRKRHSSKVTSDVDVKNSVYCDYDLLRKAKDGEINVRTPSVNSPVARFFSFQCRLCKAAFSSRSNGARHVMTKHDIVNRKGANEVIACVRIPVDQISTQSSAGRQTDADIPQINDRNDLQDTTPRSMNPNLTNTSRSHKRKFTSLEEARPRKAPKLIPLMKIKAYNEASQKMLTYYRKHYNDVLAAVNITDSPNGVRQISSTLLSLLVSTSSLMKHEQAAGKFASDVSSNPNDKMSESMEISEYATPIQKETNRDAGGTIGHLANLDYQQEEYQDMVQLYADGKLDDMTGENSYLDSGSTLDRDGRLASWPIPPSSPQIFPDFSANSSSVPSPDEGKEEETLLHHRENPDLASIKDLVDFAQQSPVLALSDRDSMDNVNSEPENLSSTPNTAPRGKYQIVASKTKSSQARSGRISSDKPPVIWRFIPDPPRKRDERGRYIREDNNNMSALLPSYGNSSRPTMVSMKSKTLPSGTGSIHSRTPERRITYKISKEGMYKGRKCPKCDKVFPWASSLSRHIMTHTGLKPYMCAICSMRFTTRSNLLRHAYRRHGLVRGSEERHNMLVTLSMNEQKEHAEQKVMKLGEGENSVDDSREVSAEEDEAGISEQVNGIPEKETLSQTDLDTTHFNKRYLCGLCRLPFANRSNLCRHLQRLHSITKDHPDFKSLLIKITRGAMPHQRNAPEIAPVSDEIVASTPPAPATPETESNENKEAKPTRFKSFTCSICAIGFTKRNNAARHIQHQHNISRKSENFSQLIIRNLPPDTTTNAVGDQTGADQSTNDQSVDDPEGQELKLELIDEEENNKDDSFNDHPAMEGSPEKVETPETAENEATEETIVVKQEAETSSWPSRRRSATRKKVGDSSNRDYEKPSKLAKQKKRDNRLAQFVCGVCKRIYKDVEDLKLHLEEHNIPHPWHCSICGVPFTNKYNCQRHLVRRHGACNMEPIYVEDKCKGPPRNPKKRARSFCR